MKIVAATDEWKHNFLVELSMGEIKFILGLTDKDGKIDENSIKIGLDLDVTSINNTMRNLRNLDTERLQGIKRDLVRAIDQVNNAVGEIEALRTFEVLGGTDE